MNRRPKVYTSHLDNACFRCDKAIPKETYYICMVDGVIDIPGHRTYRVVFHPIHISCATEYDMLIVEEVP